MHVGHDAATSTAPTPWSSPRPSATTTSSCAAAQSRACRCCTAPRRSPRRWSAPAGSPSPAPTARRRRRRCSTVALQACGVDPSFAVGGELAKHGTNAHLGTGDVFVVEADESDGSFLVYRPEVADRHQRPGRPPRLLRRPRDGRGGLPGVRRHLAAGGLLVACVDDPGARALAARAAAGPAGARPTASRPTPTRGCPARCTAGWLVRRSSRWTGSAHRLRLPVPGHHNVLNATAAFVAAAAGLGQDPEPVLAGLASFTRYAAPVRAQGPRRRGPGRRRLRAQPRQARGGRRDGRPAGRRRRGRPAGRRLPAAPLLPHPRLRARARGRRSPPCRPRRRHGRLRRARGPRAGRVGRGSSPTRCARPGLTPTCTYVPSWAAVPGVVAGLLRPGDLRAHGGSGRRDDDRAGGALPARAGRGATSVPTVGARREDSDERATEVAHRGGPIGSAVDEAPEPGRSAGRGTRVRPASPRALAGRRRSGGEARRARFERRAAAVRRRPRTLSPSSPASSSSRRAGLAGRLQLGARVAHGRR